MTALSRPLTAATGIVFTALLLAVTTPAAAATLHVAPGGTGTGTAAAPLGAIQAALDRAVPGDTILVAAGTYEEALSTVRNGTRRAPVTVRGADARGAVIVTSRGRVLTARHAHHVFERLVLDGQYGPGDIVRVGTPATGFTLRDVEVRRGARDGIDIAGAADVRIEGCLIHHTLDARHGRTDAHGIVAGPVRGLRIRGTEIHTFSGDAIQIDPGRAPAGWGDVAIEDCDLWLAPLPREENGFPPGAVPGENAVDTKAAPDGPRATLVIRNTRAHGFRNGLIPNMAAFNLKEHVDVVVDGVTVSDSEIAFRLRGAAAGGGGARVRVQNAVVHHTLTAFRYEDAIEGLRIWNSTIGLDVSAAFQPVEASRRGLDVRNLLVVTAALPEEAAGPSNLAVPASAFVDAAAGDYRLAAGSPAIDAGATVPEVTTDRVGVRRPQGRRFDVGAFEAPAVPATGLDGGPPARQTNFSWAATFAGP